MIKIYLLKEYDNKKIGKQFDAKKIILSINICYQYWEKCCQHGQGQ